MDTLRISGPGIRLVVKGKDSKPPSLRDVVDRLAYEIFHRKLGGDATAKVNLLQPEEFINLATVIVRAGDANRQSVGGRPAKGEFVEMMTEVEKLCQAVPQWPELEYFAGWIADKTSDASTALKHYQKVMDQTDRAKNPDLIKYLTAHIAELNLAASASASLAPVVAEAGEWAIDYTQFVRAIRDGGQEASVVGQALAMAMEIQIKRAFNQPVGISARYIYYVARQAEGTLSIDGGSVIKDAIGSLEKHGAVEEDVWPYKAGEYAAKPPAAVEKAPRWMITQTKSLKGLDEIKSALANDGPVVAGIEVYQEIQSPQTAKTGMVPLPQKNSQVAGGHAVVLVAYDEQKKRFKFANDWGTGWGDGGYGYLPEEYIEKHSADCWSFKVARSGKT